MASSSVFALFALLALYVAGASATSFLWYTPPTMQPYSLAMLQQQRCMTLMMQGIMSPECQQFRAMYPITHQMQQQRCMALMMQDIISPECQQFGAMYPITHQMQQQHCMALMMQGIMSPECQQFGAMSPITHQMQQQHCIALKMQGIMSPECHQFGAMYPIPPVMQGMTAPWCQCGSMCNTAAMMNNPLAYPQQCVAGCSC